MIQLEIDNEFSKLMPPLSDDEFISLENDILDDGCRHAIITWNGIIIDGHNRYNVCKKHSISFKTEEKQFDSRDDAKIWIIKNQFGRRNISTYDRSVLALKLKDITIIRAKEKEFIRKTTFQKFDKSSLPMIHTDKEIAKIAKTSHYTIHKVETIQNKGTPEQIQDIRNNKKSINEVFKIIRKEEKKEERNKLIEEGSKISITDDVRLGDFREQLKDIPDSSIDLILTDPPYTSEHLGKKSKSTLWNDFSLFASRVLKPSGFCISYAGEYYLPEIVKNLGKHLEYYWTICLYHKGPIQLVNYVNINCRWKPIFIYQKQPRKPIENPIEDYIVSEKEADKITHPWQQSESGVNKLIELFSLPGQTILDPFAGSGTVLYCCKKLKRKSIGCEIDTENYNLIKKRLMETTCQEK